MAAFVPNPCLVTSSGWDVLGCVIGNGFWDIFGNNVMMSIFLVVAGLAICLKLKVPLDLSAVFIFSIVAAGNLMFVPGWIKWLLILSMAIATGYGFYKIGRR